MTECFPFWVNSNSCLVRFFWFNSFSRPECGFRLFSSEWGNEEKASVIQQEWHTFPSLSPVEAEAVFVRGFYTA